MRKLLVGVGILLCSCATSVPRYFERPAHTSKIQAKSVVVELRDQRQDVDTGTMVVPFSPFPGQNDAQSPKLPAGLQAMVEGKAKQAITGTGVDLKIVVSIKEARKGWNVGMAKKREFTQADIEFSVTQVGSDEVLLVGNGSSWGDHTVPGIKAASLKKMLEKTVELAVANFFNQEDNIKILNKNLKGKVTAQPKAEAKAAKEETAKDAKKEAAKDAKEEAAKDTKKEAARDAKKEAAKDAKKEAAKDAKKEVKEEKKAAGKKSVPAKEAPKKESSKKEEPKKE